MIHLAEHVAIGEYLREICRTAREKCRDELTDPPSIMAEFPNKLVALGVKHNDVNNISSQGLKEVISILRRKDENEIVIPEAVESALNEKSRHFSGKPEKVLPMVRLVTRRKA